MKTPFISIVIPVKNRPQLIIRCLDSIKAQSARPLKVIVVDNGSTDDTVSEIRNWGRHNCDDTLDLTIIDEQKPGAAAARNKGLGTVNTEWVMFLDSDDAMQPALLNDLLNKINSQPSLDLIYWNCIIKTPEKDVPRCRRFGNNHLFERQIYNSLLCTVNFAVKTQFIREIGGWDILLRGWDDWELGIRLLLNKPNIAYIPKMLSVIYPQAESITGTDYQSKSGIWETAIDSSEKAVTESDTYNHDRSRLLRMINYRRVNLAALYRREGRADLALPLLKKSLNHPTTTKFRKFLLKIIYAYTSRGGRMAYKIWF